MTQLHVAESGMLTRARLGRARANDVQRAQAPRRAKHGTRQCRLGRPSPAGRTALRTLQTRDPIGIRTCPRDHRQRTHFRTPHSRMCSAVRVEALNSRRRQTVR
jgi:hypothetical protein